MAGAVVVGAEVELVSGGVVSVGSGPGGAGSAGEVSVGAGGLGVVSTGADSAGPGVAVAEGATGLWSSASTGPVDTPKHRTTVRRPAATDLNDRDITAPCIVERGSSRSMDGDIR